MPLSVLKDWQKQKPKKVRVNRDINTTWSKTRNDRNTKWSKHEMVKTGNGQNRKWSKDLIDAVRRRHPVEEVDDEGPGSKYNIIIQVNLV